MSYEIIFGEGALDRLRGLPPEVIDGVEASLAQLAAEPSRLSRKATFPYPPHGQMFPFHCDHAGKRYWFVAFFYYGEDERSLRVFDVTATTY